LNVELANDFFAQIVVIAKDIDARKRLQSTLETILAEQFPSAVTRVSPLGLGPPVGWPIQYRVSGPDLSKVRDIGLQLGQIVATDSSARQVNFDWMEPARAVRVHINQDQARLLGLSSESIAGALTGVVTGSSVTQVRDGIYLVPVIARATQEQRLSLSVLRNLQIQLPNNRAVSLSQIATLEFDQEFPLIWRRNRIPTLTVQADVAQDQLPESVVTRLTPAIEKLNAELPNQYRVEVGGTIEEAGKSQASVIAAVPLMMFLMVTLLMMQLQSFSRLLLVLSTVPLGLIGVIVALLGFVRPLGFVAILVS
jgi:multidrug efflux pump subunit AcrB